MMKHIPTAVLCLSFVINIADADELKRPAGNDYTAASLRLYESALLKRYGNSPRKIPLAVKAAHFEWSLGRYHMAPWYQAHSYASLPAKVGAKPEYRYLADNSTWNGALLAALSFKYAVTKDKQTLQLIDRLIDGLHFFKVVTKRPGLLSRVVMKIDKPYYKVKYRFVNSDKSVYHFRCDPAKGTYNQVVAGYAAFFLFVEPDLPAHRRQRARDDLAELALHLIQHDYRIHGLRGKPTKYGDLRPLFAGVGIPFNAQVAYMIVATSAHFPPANPGNARAIHRAYRRLRSKHHVYYEDPLFNWVPPQRVAASPFIKGMNDRNHVINAAFIGLMIERDAAKREKRPVDRRFVYELGRTMYWGMSAIDREHNALCNFIWAGLLKDRATLKAVVPRDTARTQRQLTYITSTGLEQLRRYPLDRFSRPGRSERTRIPQWIDAGEPHNSYAWKSGAFERFVPTGPPTNIHTASIDYLYAYWVMRYFGLDKRR